MLEQIIETLKEYGYEVTEDDKNIRFMLNRTEDKVKNHCSIVKIPSELETLIIEMCVNAIIEWKELQAAMMKTESGVGNVTSVKAGDEQTNFDNGTASHVIVKDFVDRKIKEYKSELNKFRCFRR